jgi:hypothetical protein
MKPKLYKRLTEDLHSPCKPFQWEIGKPVVCTDYQIGKFPNEDDCPIGLYYLKLEQLIYWHQTLPIFEVEISGESQEWGGKCRAREMVIIRKCEPHEIIEAIEQSGLEKKVGYKYAKALFPVNPLLLNFGIEPTKHDIELLRQWQKVGDSVWDSIEASVGNSVRDSVEASVWDSVKASVGDSVGDSVWNSVWDSVKASVGVGDSVGNSVWNSVWNSVVASVGNSVRAYIGSMFPNIEKWRYIDHKKGIYPFQPAVDLWYRGLVPSFDGKLWRLHSGPDAMIVWEDKPIPQK